MLYIIAGASRSGKTLLSRKAVSDKKIPYFPLDALFGAMVHGAPEFNIKYEDSLIDRPIKMWPLAKHMISYFFKEESDYLIEGDSILPSQVSELIGQGKPIKCCFLGYTEMTKDEKLALIRQHHQGDIDWTKNLSDEEMLPLIEEMIEFSKYLKQECEKCGIKYFDISHDFDGVRDEAFEYLFG